MEDYYSILDKLIKEEIDKNQIVAIYPLGKVGLQARDILFNRYGFKKGIIIDNFIAKYNNEVMDVNDFFKIDNSNISIILCTSTPDLNAKMLRELEEKNVKAQLRNIINNYSITCYPEKEKYFKQVKELCKVKKAIGYELVRVGKRHDGGYIMLNDFREEYIAYSFGIGGEASWDQWMAECGIHVDCYDHTIKQLPYNHAGVTFHKIGISGVDHIDESLLSMTSILHENGHEKKDNLILKMDVEGAEWDFINSVSSDVLNQFLQITLELHDLTSIEYSEKVVSALEKINKTHQVVWVHANNNGGVEQANDIVMPRLLEITYANKNKYMFDVTSYNCPLDIDDPNIENCFDVVLKDWGTLKL